MNINMNIIDRALEQNLHITDNENLKSRTWSEFEIMAGSRSVWIAGVGKAAGFVWRKYGSDLKIGGIIDNDRRKQGKFLEDYIGIAKDTPAGRLVIKGIEALKSFEPDEVIVLVTSVRYYEDIANQIEAMGITNIFTIIIMEAKERENILADKMKEKNLLLSPEEIYAVECMKEPVEENKILVFIGNHGCHVKQITRKLVEMSADLDIVWILRNKLEEIPAGIRTVMEGDWKAYVWELETAHVWIYEEMIPEFAHKRVGQIYIQTKHWSSITLKKFYWDTKDHLKIPSIKKLYAHNNEAIDYIFVGSKFDEESCRSGFDFSGECVFVGSPRTDILFECGVKEKVSSFYGLPSDKHILLYCPTFRSSHIGSPAGKMKYVDVDFEGLIWTLEEKFGGEWLIFLRIHPNVAIESSKYKLSSKVIDASYYCDSQELVAASDIVMTDYSSMMFEPAFVKKPVFLYAPDKEEYIGKDRGLLIDYDSLPFPISKNDKELTEAIMEFEEEAYYKKVKSFLEFYDVHEDGHASERAAKFILSLLE